MTIILILFILQIFHSQMIEESYSIFHKYTLPPLLKQLDQQQNTFSCSIKDGPLCFHFSNINNLPSQELLKKQLNPNSNSPLTLNSIYDKLNSDLQQHKENYGANIDSTIKIPIPQRKMLLSFESYDQITLQKDIYMPEERVMNYPRGGALKMNFKGKLRLTNAKEKENLYNIEDGPNGTFGIVESQVFQIFFDPPVIPERLYLRTRSETKNNLSINGYYKDELIFDINSDWRSDGEWFKIEFPGDTKAVTELIFENGLEIDDIFVSIDDNNVNNENKSTENNFDLSEIIYKLIDKLNENKNKNKFEDDE